MEEDVMRTDKNSESVIVTLIAIVALSLMLFITCQRERKVNAEPVNSESQWDKEVIRAYNHLLHRVWIDRPSYVEDVLTETDEFVVLDSLLNGHWEDTFEFYSEEDSIAYHMNQYYENAIDPGCVRVIKHIVKH